MGCNLPGSSAHWILQARILEWITISSSRGSSQPRNWTWVSCIAGQLFTTEPPGNPFRSWLRHFTKATQSVSGGPGTFPQGKEATVTRKGSNAFFSRKKTTPPQMLSVHKKREKKLFFLHGEFGTWIKRQSNSTHCSNTQKFFLLIVWSFFVVVVFTNTYFFPSLNLFYGNF